ncbi:epoxyqueuosine reductase QueH [Pseudothermotoga thermarum]|uniref:Epoxyqueuosine reductase QueH n=1 Tax=Pseudothermotoga thermarum DSM 5069 TaxID=688269 RepID=F7YX74_9THEM|nr:epoxyqueuosine reductase QueH [Pseudothermotoga thermarum]AEH51134.1 protein of unknown function DUF208 [Pseudothermotoga thermarum DSM 5069]
MKVLLHVCCAPDATVAVKRLRQSGLEPILYFYNPNIEPIEEYEKRLEATKLLAEAWGLELIEDRSGYDEWKDSIKGLENLGERSKRCEACIAHRLKKTALKALSLGVEFFCTTLTTSPKKDSKYINSLGKKLELEFGVKFLEADFKKQDGFKQSVELSKALGLYRQNYCGCIYSLKEKQLRSGKDETVHRKIDGGSSQRL